MKNKLFVILMLLVATAGQAQYVNLPAVKEDILPKTDYVIYIPWGTLPTLYAGLHMYMHKKPSFLWFLREGTLDVEQLPAHVTMVGTPGKENAADINLIVKTVADIIAENSEASFTLYTDDMQSGRITLAALVANGVKEGNFFVRILSDGSGTYNFYKDLFGTSGAGVEVYNQASNYYYSLYRRTRDNRNSLVIPSNNQMWADLANQMFALASFPFAELWLTYPDLLSSNDVRMGFPRMLINTRTVSPSLLFSSLSKIETEGFMQLFNFDKNYYDALLKPATIKVKKPVRRSATAKLVEEQEELVEVVEKPKLIITAPDPLPVRLGSTLKKIVTDYGDDYDIFLKPHPSAMPTATQIASYKKLGIIEVLPARMPMELLLWLYPSLKIGGFQSSLYMSVLPGQTLFFISNNHQGLPEPLYSLYQQGGFPDVKFYPMPVS